MSDEAGNVEGASNLLGLFAPLTPHSNNNSSKTLNREDAVNKIPEDEEDPTQTPTYQSFDAMRSYDDVNKAEADLAAPAGSIGYMMGLFSSSGGSSSKKSEPAAKLNGREFNKETSPLLESSMSSWLDADTPKIGVRNRKSHETRKSAHHIRLPSLAMPSIEESTPRPSIKLVRETGSWIEHLVASCKHCAMEAAKPTTLIGSFMYLLYHIVFCLALGSAINRPHSPTSLLGLMTKTAALGTITSSVVYWWNLSSEIPALYPTAVRVHFSFFYLFCLNLRATNRAFALRLLSPDPIGLVSGSIFGEFSLDH